MNQIKIFGFKVNNLIFYFIFCSFIGWCVEAAYMFLIRGRFVFSGLLHCPFSPIYGFGGLLLIIVLNPVKHNIALFFLGAVFLTTVLEYITGSLIMVTLHKMIWNYKNEFLNLNGLICLKTSLAWGILSVGFSYFIKPLITYFICHVPNSLKTGIAFTAILFFILKAGSL